MPLYVDTCWENAIAGCWKFFWPMNIRDPVGKAQKVSEVLWAMLAETWIHFGKNTREKWRPDGSISHCVSRCSHRLHEENKFVKKLPTYRKQGELLDLNAQHSVCVLFLWILRDGNV
jgi:hypothetical protein